MNGVNKLNCVEVKNVSKAYSKFSLNDVSFSVPSGYVVGLIGENGAGKSTLIKMMLGAISPDSGEISVFGEKMNEHSLQLKDNIGIVLDEPFFPANFNVKEINKVMSGIYSEWDESKFFSFAERFNLPFDKKYSKFSRGMKMKLSIASALSHNAKLLVLDEPTGGLDPIVRDEILDIFNEFTMNEDNSILISSHIVSDLEKICDYIAFIHNGRLVFFESKDFLEEKYAIASVSLEDLQALPDDEIIGVQKNAYGAKVLVKKDNINPSIPVVRAGIEDIILFIVRGGKQ